jgi:hypothetical protein
MKNKTPVQQWVTITPLHRRLFFLNPGDPEILSARAFDQPSEIFEVFKSTLPLNSVNPSAVDHLLQGTEAQRQRNLRLS